MQEDPGKDYLSSKTKQTKFEHYPLKEEVIRLLEDNNFKKPTLVQAQSLPITLQDNLKNLCAIIYAYNGAGKTLTYLIPILNALANIPCIGHKFQKNKDFQIGRPQALIVVPTEALLAQIYDYLVAYSDFYAMAYKWTVKIGRIYSTVYELGHIIVGLPAKMKEKLTQPGIFDFSELKWVVFDECDKLKEDTSNEFSDILNVIADPKFSNSNANILITSATGNKDNFRKYIQDHLVTYNVLELDSYDENKGLKGVSHFFSTNTNKDTVIFSILQKITKVQLKPQVIIFFNTIPELRYFYNLLRKEKDRFVVNDPRASDIGKYNLKVDYVHSQCTSVCRKGRDHFHPDDCSASKTNRVAKLRNKEIQVLLGTETIGRGIDIRTVTLVINYNEPVKRDKTICTTSYIHRVGRTGRYSDVGIALTFVASTVFVKTAEEDQKIKFQQMTSEEEIVKQTVDCLVTNERITQIDKHRYEVQ